MRVSATSARPASHPNASRTSAISRGPSIVTRPPVPPCPRASTVSTAYWSPGRKYCSARRFIPCQSPPQPVQQHDRRPAARRRGTGGDVERRQRQPVARRDGHVLLRPGGGDAGPGGTATVTRRRKCAARRRRVAPRSYNRLMDERPVGVFDSGWVDCRPPRVPRHAPARGLHYVGDGARCPTGRARPRRSAASPARSPVTSRPRESS